MLIPNILFAKRIELVVLILLVLHTRVHTCVVYCVPALGTSGQMILGQVYSGHSRSDDVEARPYYIDHYILAQLSQALTKFRLDDALGQYASSIHICWILNMVERDTCVMKVICISKLPTVTTANLRLEMSASSDFSITVDEAMRFLRDVLGMESPERRLETNREVFLEDLMK